MNLSSLGYLGIGSALMCACWVAALIGFPAREGQVVPMSVRENPASFRPVYSVWSGWHPAPSSGGGFGFGK